MKVKSKSIVFKKNRSQVTENRLVKKSIIDQEETQYNMFEQTLSLIEDLHQMRFIERISRPIERVKKE